MELAFRLGPISGLELRETEKGMRRSGGGEKLERDELWRADSHFSCYLDHSRRVQDKAYKKMSAFNPLSP